MYFSNYLVLLEKIEVKFGLIFVISSSDFQTSSTLLTFFVLGHRLLTSLRIIFQTSFSEVESPIV